MHPEEHAKKHEYQSQFGSDVSPWFGQWGNGPVKKGESKGHHRRSLSRSEHPWGRIFDSGDLPNSAQPSHLVERSGVGHFFKCLLTLGTKCGGGPKNPVKEELKKKGKWHEHINYDYGKDFKGGEPGAERLVKRGKHHGHGDMGPDIERKLSNFPKHLQQKILQNREALLVVPDDGDSSGLSKRSLSDEEIVDKAIAYAFTIFEVAKDSVTMLHDRSLSNDSTAPSEQHDLEERGLSSIFASIICNRWDTHKLPFLAVALNNVQKMAHVWCFTHDHRWDVPQSPLWNQSHWGSWNEVEGGYPQGERAFGMITWDEHGKPTIRPARAKEQAHYFKRYGKDRAQYWLDNHRLLRPGSPVQ